MRARQLGSLLPALLAVIIGGSYFAAAAAAAHDTSKLHGEQVAVRPGRRVYTDRRGGRRRRDNAADINVIVVFPSPLSLWRPAAFGKRDGD